MYFEGKGRRAIIVTQRIRSIYLHAAIRFHLPRTVKPSHEQPAHRLDAAVNASVNGASTQTTLGTMMSSAWRALINVDRNNSSTSYRMFGLTFLLALILLH